MRIPKSIKPGDTIGFCAPSFGVTIEPYVTRFEAAKRAFTERGYKLKIAESCYKDDGLGISTKPEDAAADLMELYLDPEVDAVISVGGGELMNETISCLDFEKLAEAPAKWYMGYSDNTNMLMPMALLADTAGIYGPCASSFGKVWEDTEKDAFSIMEGKVKHVSGYPGFELPSDGKIRQEDPLHPYVITQPKILRSFLPENGELKPAAPNDTIRFEGAMLGGCLDVLVNLSGTEFDRVRAFNETHDRVIWVLEACDLNPMAIRRSVWTLKHQGWFEKASGFLIGRPMAAFQSEMMGVDSYNAVTDVVKELGVPVIMDVDIGHVSPMMPVVIGADAGVLVVGNEIGIKFAI